MFCFARRHVNKAYENFHIASCLVNFLLYWKGKKKESFNIDGEIKTYKKFCVMHNAPLGTIINSIICHRNFGKRQIICFNYESQIIEYKDNLEFCIKQNITYYT
ncbi:hypothetical protein RIR_jg26702.t1 [Rhizophagus irregularis DAOM 181602=DAOM 197198]|nr:hypothetical protein RIR_jg26702.t1 [Rhizophagus irregularis DAOM 181602=DAOM 197198]